jgi:hypothetical protein
MDSDPDRPGHVIAAIPAGAERDSAEKALGAFPFPFTVTTAAPPILRGAPQ